ncbi:MAG: hypothetical protein GY811_00010 [Myxococcales bacterium]|nr:hypothetical protein [Myxococcales bacterium]
MKTLALAKVLAAGFLLAAQVSCGGTQSTREGGGTPGQSHSTSSASGDEVTDGGDDDIDAPLGSPPPVVATDPPAAASDSPVTFVLKNSGNESLFLNMDKGWSAVIYAYSGTPPNAKSILMFQTHCTASCDSAPEDVCPLCEAPERLAEIRAAENHDEVAVGDQRAVPWDGLAFSYKKTRGTRNNKHVRCSCSTTAEPAPETYTIKACGLRKTQSAKSRSKYQCVESTISLPVTEPVTVELDFGNP